MNLFEVNAEARTDTGKGASRRLRRAGQVPAILYGAGQEPQMLSVSHNALLRHLEEEAFYTHLLTIKTGDKAEKAVLKDLQRHPAKPFILHADFQRVDANTTLHMHIPLHFINEDTCVGVKTGGGAISHQVVEVLIHCLPKDLPEYIEVDMHEVQLGQTLHLSDLKLPEGVELPELSQGQEHDHPVVTVHKGRGGTEEDEETGEEA
jgi:large subunit ribosomal protein L25